jgi:glycerol-3-phosphate acyltransferase PlsY
MHAAILALLLLAAYLLGSIPFGLIVVRLTNGRDLRTVESGRTGGTNAMRAAGPWAGLLTGLLDIVKAAGVVLLAKTLTPDAWVHTLTAIAAILGHNYSIFLAERRPEGGLRLRGGAGGSATGGGAAGLWPPILLILLPLAGLIWYGIGFASVTTMSIALITIVVFTVRAALGLSPWQYVLYGVLAEALLLIALRPNIGRLLKGTERRHGWRARHAG